MDQQALTIVLAIITTLVGFITAGIWWWVNSLWSLVREQQKELSDLGLEVARNHMPRAEVQEALRGIFEMLREIQKEMRAR